MNQGFNFKHYIAVCLLALPLNSQASESVAYPNPAFPAGGTHQVMVGMTQGGQGDDLELKGWQIEYAQPNSFFRLPGKRSLLAGRLSGDGFGVNNHKCQKDACEKLDQVPYIGLQQSAFWGKPQLYVGGSIGAVLFHEQSSRVHSDFSFNQRVMVGTQLGKLSVEAVWLHFSNGGLEPSPGINTYGLNIGAVF